MKKFLLLAICIICSAASIYAKDVSVTVIPEHATIMHDGKVIQPVTPGVFNLKVGLFMTEVFTVQADGYDSHQFVLNSKSPASIQVTLKPNRKQVSFSAEPSTATIYVNGKELGQGAVDFEIRKNENKTVKVILDGYDTITKNIGFNDQKDINMAFGVTLTQNRKEVNILVDANAAEFYLDGVLIAKGNNTATATLHKGKDSQLVVRAEGFLEYSRILKFSENISSYNLTQEMAQDQAWVASEPGADIANKRTEFTVRGNMTREDAIKRMKYYIGEIFETYEVNDNYSGWYRTIWNVEAYPGSQYIRTRVEIKEIPDNGDGVLKFKFLIQSQITTKEHAKDEDYKNWDRILKKYMKLAMDLRHIVE